MTAIIQFYPTIFLVWMIGFSGDSRGLRMGGFVLLSIQWLAPRLLYAVPDFLSGQEALSADFAVRTVLSLLVGAYLIMWAVRSAQTMPVRIATAVAALVSLWPTIVLGVMTIAAPG